MATIKEAAKVVEAGPGRMLIKLIDPGQGSSGFYSAAVLEAAAADKVFPRGTQMHINHDSELEMLERPEGDLRDLAAVLQEDAYVNEQGALVAEALVGSAWKTFLDEFKDFIGASIVADADIVRTSEGKVIEKLLPSPLNRVDFVTVAGRGGSILKVLESAQGIAKRSMVNEAFTEDKRSILSKAVRGVQRHGWLSDYDDDFVIYEAEEGLERRSYTLDGTTATLGDDASPVQRRVEYDPITLPSETAGVQENAKLSKEDIVAKIEIDETELEQLRESASRVQALEAAEAERVERDKTSAKEARVAKASEIIREAFGSEETPALFQRIAESSAAAEDFDLEAFRTEVSEAAALQSVQDGAGTPRGLGETTDKVVESATKVVSDEDTINALHGKA